MLEDAILKSVGGSETLSKSITAALRIVSLRDRADEFPGPGLVCLRDRCVWIITTDKGTSPQDKIILVVAQENNASNEERYVCWERVVGCGVIAVS